MTSTTNRRTAILLLGVILLAVSVTMVTAAGKVAGTDDADDTGTAGDTTGFTSRYATPEDATRGLLESASNTVGLVTKTVPGTNKGRKACAYAVSVMLQRAGLVEDGFVNEENKGVTTLVDNLKQRGWTETSTETSNLREGDIIVWGPSRHVGVYWGDQMAISNSSGKGQVKRHPLFGYYSGWSRLVTVLRYTGR